MTIQELEARIKTIEDKTQKQENDITVLKQKLANVPLDKPAGFSMPTNYNNDNYSVTDITSKL